MKRQPHQTNNPWANSKLICVALFAGTVSANALALTDKNTELTESMSIEYEQGLITAAIKQAPFSKVIQSLQAKTGVRFELNSSAINDEKITVTLGKLPLQEGIRTILYGYSYALDSSSGTTKIIILTYTPTKDLAETNTPPVLNIAQNNIPISPPIELVDSVVRTDCPPDEGITWHGKFICPPL